MLENIKNQLSNLTVGKDVLYSIVLSKKNKQAVTVLVKYYVGEDEDEAEFCLETFSTAELAELFENFCRECGYKECPEIFSVEVVRTADTLDELTLIEEQEAAGNTGREYAVGEDSEEYPAWISRGGRRIYLTEEEMVRVYHTVRKDFCVRDVQNYLSFFLSEAEVNEFTYDLDFLELASRHLDRLKYELREANLPDMVNEAIKSALRRYKKLLFVDMDGTLTQFIYQSGMDDIYREGYFLNLQPQKKVVDAIGRIVAEHKEIDVFILSSYLVDHATAREEKDSWLDLYLPEIPTERRIFVPNGTSKKDYLTTLSLGYSVGNYWKNATLLDDHTPNLLKWAPWKAIKLMNDINGRGGTWKGPKVSYDTEPEELVRKILEVVKKD